MAAPDLVSPFGPVTIPPSSRERIEENVSEWADQAGDALVAAFTAIANGKLEEARSCFAAAERCAARAQVLIGEALAMATAAAGEPA